jgi:hypothetical protein
MLKELGMSCKVIEIILIEIILIVIIIIIINN